MAGGALILTGIEDIGELAGHSDTRQRVADLTRSAMGRKVNLETVDGERLEMLQPTRGAVRALRSRYLEHLVEDAAGLEKVSAVKNLKIIRL